MEKAGIKYPCKPFPYKKHPTWVKYPCKGNEPQIRSSSPPKLLEEEKGEEKEEENETQKLNKIENERVYHGYKRKCSYPYFLSCNRYCQQRYRRPIPISTWDRQFLDSWEREKENLVCISPPLQDSYELLCKIPKCEPEPVKYVRKREEFNPLFCVFCNESLYKGGYISDLYNTVPGIKMQSREMDDDISYRIGIRTRIHVHKSCYNTYIKKPVTYLLNGGEAEFDPGI